MKLLLIEEVKSRVRNGQVTERRLARLIGVSQPHLHNVLKGVRILSSDVADRLLRRLQISLPDVVATAAAAAPCRMVAILEGRIGPGHAFPLETSGREKQPILEMDLAGVEFPLAARLAPDPCLPAELAGRESLVLLDCSERQRQKPEPGNYFAVDLGGESAVRLLRRSGPGFDLVGRDTLDCRALPVADDRLPEVLKGRVVLVMRRL